MVRESDPDRAKLIELQVQDAKLARQRGDKSRLGIVGPWTQLLERHEATWSPRVGFGDAEVGEELCDESLVDTSRQGTLDPIETRQKRYEQMYYLQFPDVLTISEFAKKVAEVNEWS